MARDLPVAVLDACVLAPMPLADTLLRLAEHPALYKARWSDEILKEMSRTLSGRFGKSVEKAAYREQAMRAHFPHALVQDFEGHVPEMQNHLKDRHVLAAAVRCRADYLVTLNLKDFPTKSVEEYTAKVVGPSVFLKTLWQTDEALVRERLNDQAKDIGVPISDLLDRLAKSVPRFVAQIQDKEA